MSVLFRPLGRRVLLVSRLLMLSLLRTLLLLMAGLLMIHLLLAARGAIFILRGLLLFA